MARDSQTQDTEKCAAALTQSDKQLFLYQEQWTDFENNTATGTQKHKDLMSDDNSIKTDHNEGPNNWQAESDGQTSASVFYLLHLHKPE